MTLLRFALDNLLRRPARTALTVAAVALGIAAVVALTSIAWGFEASWQTANDARGTDLIVTRLASENAMPSPFVGSPLQQALQQRPKVQQVVGLLSELLGTGDNAPPVFVFGWAHGSYLWDHLKLVDGRWPGAAAAELVMGSLAAELLHKHAGDSVEVEGRRFRVVGTFESSAIVENGALLMTLRQMQEITDKPDKVNVLNVKLDPDTSDADIVGFKRWVHDHWPGYAAITSGALVQQNTVVRISKAMSSATIAIACLVGALMVFNSMLMSISERTREIGLLLAIGWQQRTVMGLIVSESVAMSVVGGLLGIALGMGLAAGMAHMALLRGKIDPLFSPLFLLSVVVLSAVLGAAGRLYPAWKACGLRPAQALRHE